MSVKEFNATIQDNIFKQWLAQLDKNIISNSVKEMRSSQQTADKTDFYLSSANIRNIYKKVTNLDMTRKQAREVLKRISNTGNNSGKAIRVGRTSGILYESIGFDTISTKVKEVFDQLEGVQEAYDAAIQEYTIREYAKIDSNPKLSKGSDIQAARDKVDKYARENIGTFGNFIHKGHVISIATNTAKNLANSIREFEGFKQEQKDILLQVLDKYISKLEKDDIESSNLAKYPLAQRLYAKYIKSPNKYLVELQFSKGNLDSGSSSLPIVLELRKLFSSGDIDNVLLKSPNLGTALVKTKGSPSYIDLITKNLASVFSTGKELNTVYTMPNTLVAERILRVKPTNNKSEVRKLKDLKTNVAKLARETKLKTLQNRDYSLTSLQMLINSSLQHVISANMGDGAERKILNYRTGRFAASAKVEKMSQSREGMITAFYTYMKNPYQTFEPGFAQGHPASRDPKLLISKSIREIAATKVGNRLRAVLV